MNAGLWCGAAVALLVAASFKVQGQGSVDPIGLQRAEFTIADVHYQILLPQGSMVRLPSGEADFVVIRPPHTTRRLRDIKIGPVSSKSDETHAVTKRLSTGAVLRYTIAIETQGHGSGGQEGELKGRLEIGTSVLAVHCHDQDELLPRPEWCVQYLHHLRVDIP